MPTLPARLLCVLALSLGGGTGGAAHAEPGCRFESLPAASGELAARAVCEWALPTERISAALHDLEAHPQVLSGLAASELLPEEEGGVRSLQIHRQRGMSDRAVVVDWRFEELPDRDGDGLADGERLSWRRADDQQAARGRGVVPKACEGAWQIEPIEGGTRVRYELRYAPGGGIPWFVLRQFDQVAVRSVTEELHRALATPDVAAR